MVSLKKIEIASFLRKQRLSLVDTDFLKNLSGLKNQQSLAGFVNSLVKYGVLERAEKGKYLVKDNLGNDFLVANLLYRPSYLSLETALNTYGILSQFPMEITSVTTKRKMAKNITGKLYLYYHLDSKLFWGYEKKEEALVALPEKALLDMIYLSSKGIKNIEIGNLDLFAINKKIFIDFSKKFPQGKKFKILVREVLGQQNSLYLGYYADPAGCLQNWFPTRKRKT